jgi:hypothetical protein
MSTGLALSWSAAYSGLLTGDVIVGANKRKAYDIKSLEAALQLSTTSVLLRVDRNGVSLFIVVRKALFALDTSLTVIFECPLRVVSSRSPKISQRPLFRFSKVLK